MTKLSDQAKRNIALLLGKPGLRTLDFIEFGEKLINESAETQAKKSGEVLSYCLREALNSVIPSYAELDKQNINTKENKLLAVHREFVDSKAAGVDIDDFLYVKLDEALEEYSNAIGRKLDHKKDSLGKFLIHLSGLKTINFPILQKYVNLIQKCNKGLHNEIEWEFALQNWSQGMELMETLFLPVEDRFAALESLAKIEFPGSNHLQELKNLAISPRHLSNFLEKVESFSWVNLIVQDRYLSQIPDDFSWPTLIFFEKFGQSHSKELIEILKTLSANATFTNQSQLILAAIKLLPESEEFVVNYIRENSESPAVIFAAQNALENMNSSSSAVTEIAEVLLRPNSINIQRWIKPVLQCIEQGLNETNLMKRIQIICTAILNQQREGELNFLRIFPKGTLEANFEEYFTGSSVELISTLINLLKSADPVLEISELQQSISNLPDDILRRITPWIFAMSSKASKLELLTELTNAVNTRIPTGDDVMLFNRLESLCSQEDLNEICVNLLGIAPKNDEEIHEENLANLKRKASWILVFPNDVMAPWIKFVENSEKTSFWYSKSDLVLKDPTNISIGRSPFTQDQLSMLSLDEICELVRTWRPKKGDFLVSVRELARTFEIVVVDQGTEWLRNPVEVITKLRHPTYVSHYLKAILELSKTGVHLEISQICDAIKLVDSRPWTVEVIDESDGFSFDETWSPAIDTAIQLLKQLLDSDKFELNQVDLAWDIFERTSNNTESLPSISGNSIDFLQLAINCSSTKATEAIISLADFEFRTTASVHIRYFNHFEKLLNYGNQIGLMHRSIIASKFQLLRKIGPSWVTSNGSLLFGAELENDIGQNTLNMTLKWSSKIDRWLLEKFRNQIFIAAENGIDNALAWIANGMFWSLRGYSAQNIFTVFNSDVQKINDFTETVARITRGGFTKEEYVQSGIEYWKCALNNRKFSADYFLAFGWMSEVQKMENGIWEDLTLTTLQRTNGSIDWMNGVIERIDKTEGSLKQIEILNYMLMADVEPWKKYGIYEVSIRKLCEFKIENESAPYIRLRGSLLERGVELPPDVSP